MGFAEGPGRPSVFLWLVFTHGVFASNVTIRSSDAELGADR